MKLSVLTKHFENLIYFSCMFACFWLCYSYVQLGTGVVWFLGSFPYLSWVILASKMGCFDWLVMLADKKFKKVIGKREAMLEREKMYTDHGAQETDEWYEIMRPAVMDSELQLSVR